jgi:hypothetical protein
VVCTLDLVQGFSWCEIIVLQVVPQTSCRFRSIGLADLNVCECVYLSSKFALVNSSGGLHCSCVYVVLLEGAVQHDHFKL